jgi:hypothetical protein
VLAPWLARVHHHQLFFAGMDNRRAAPRALIRRRGEKRRPLKPPPPVAARPGTRGTQLALLDAAAARDYRQVLFDLRRDAAPADPGLGPAPGPVACQNSCRASDLGFYPRRSCSFAGTVALSDPMIIGQEDLSSAGARQPPDARFSLPDGLRAYT